MLITSSAQETLVTWLEVAQPIIHKRQGDNEESWQAIRENYMTKLDHLFPTPTGVRFSSVNLGGMPAVKFFLRLNKH